jgi:hypothetical protein
MDGVAGKASWCGWSRAVPTAGVNLRTADPLIPVDEVLHLAKLPNPLHGRVRRDGARNSSEANMNGTKPWSFRGVCSRWPANNARSL